MLTSHLLKVIIVEDDPMVQRINEEFLNKIEGFSCVACFDQVSNAMAYLSEEKVDLVLLDIYFQDAQGVDLLKWIRKEDLDVDVIMITADKSSHAVELTRRYGVIDYLVKPFKFERFKEAIERYAALVDKSDQKTMLTQEEINQLLHVPTQSPKEEAKNLTLEMVYKFLKDHVNSGYTATEIAQKLGISRITARRYLEELEMQGIVKLELVYGGVGRPQNLYHYVQSKGNL